MSRRSFLTHWRGLLLSEIGIAAGLWLAFSGRLNWYIHPRYTGFTVTMLLIAAVAVPLAFAALSVRGTGGAEEGDGDACGSCGPGECGESCAPDEHPGPHEVDDPGSRPRARRMAVWGSALLLGIAACALLILPPATLTASTAEQRQMNASVVSAGGEGDAAELLAAADGAGPGELSVRDWSMLLRQGESVTGQQAELTGFVAPDPESSDAIFYVSRFVVTCCAVDAQPVGVPVHLPDWQESAAEDDWVRIVGVFAPNPDAASDQPVVLRAEGIEPIEAPKDPYVY